jgi:hypothetical protein
MEVLMTRIRLIKSKKKIDLLRFINLLPYKIEIKSISFCPLEKKWCVWFVPGDDIEISDVLEISLD